MATHHEVVYTYETSFLLLPKKQQEVWKVLWYFSNEFKTAFPSHDTIAKLAHCCVRTVRTCIKKFTMMGWIETSRRYYQSCIFYIHEALKKINPKNQQIFRNKKKSCEQNGQVMNRERGVFSEANCSMNCSVSNVAKDSIDTVRYNVHQTRILKDGKWLSIRPNLQKYPFPTDEKLKIQRCFTESEIALAAESYDSYKNTPRAPIKLFWWLCKEAKRMFKYGK